MTNLYIALGSALLGFVIFLAILKLLPQRLNADLTKERTDLLDDARRQAELRKAREKERLEEERQLRSEQLETEIHERLEDIKLSEEDLASRERTSQLEENRIQKLTKDVEAYEEKVALLRADYEAKAEEIKAIKVQLVEKLEQVSGLDAGGVKRSLHDKVVESRQFEQQKALRILDEELSTSSKRVATRAMARAMARYAPDFYWPKMLNSVEVMDRAVFDRLLGEEEPLLAELKEKAEIEIEGLPGNEGQIPLIKLAGGAGINREAARLALEELVAKGPSTWGKGAAVYDRHRAQLEGHALLLGRQAIKEVGLENIHPEIQRLVGYLNWRTSYRQNQWYHTVEVAKLAGIIAAELGVDIDAAKRVGLLHDIGKALDYRIEGSHAVISGDYADRYGERRIICDTVMSHHNDLIVESPLAYVLRAADTLSGARPGARVNLEEGYQTRLSGIESAVRSFPGIIGISIMNGGREVHVEVNHKRIREQDLQMLSHDIARKIEADVAFPGEIKVMVTRRFEATAVA